MSSSNLKGAFIALTSLFFMWGFITVMVDPLVPFLKEVFELGYFEAGFVQVAWFLAYFLFAIPLGTLLAKVGYKKGILIGLAIAGVGCLLIFPAAEFRMYGFFLLALFVIASGITLLQVAANPYIAVLGPAEGASSRLNLAQAFNSLGTTIAPLLAASFILSTKVSTQEERLLMDPETLEATLNAEAASAQDPFLILAGFIVLLILIFAFVKLPKILRDDANTGTYASVIKDKRLRFGALAIFVYVGAEVALSSWAVDYGLSLGLEQIVRDSTVLSALGELAAWIKGVELSSMDAKSVVGVLVTLYWGGAMVGRFIGSILMRKIAPTRMLTIFGSIAAILVLVSILTSGTTAFVAMLAVGLFNSIMFPTIFTLGISNLGDDAPLGSGVLCTAIVGGAVIPPAMGFIVDNTMDGQGWAFGLILPILCYVYIAWYASAAFQRKAAA